MAVTLDVAADGLLVGRGSSRNSPVDEAPDLGTGRGGLPDTGEALRSFSLECDRLGRAGGGVQQVAHVSRYPS